MAAEKIDVLAVMSRASNALVRVDVDDILRADLIAARAAIAELIEAANRGLPCVQHDRIRAALVAALARVGGA